MEWTRKNRYLSLADVDKEYLEKLKEKVDQSIWRQGFHIQPPMGLLNDPNGFSYYKGRYHLFYQWFPLGPVHGLKHWYHVSSQDLMYWEDHGLALKPEMEFESHGIFSGSAFEKDGKLFLYYTGNHRDKDWERTSSQALAIMDDNYKIEKKRSPLIKGSPEGYTDHYRDPKVWKENGVYWMILGAQNKALKGEAVLYESEDALDWNFKGPLKTEFESNAFMWECPDLFALDGKSVLIVSPQGLEKENESNLNIYQSGYLLGPTMSSPLDTFDHGEFVELDHGFDFYAPQTIEHKDQRILIAWMGLPEIDYPSDKDGWAHCMTLPRLLSVEDGILVQRPHPNLKLLRKRQESYTLKENENKIYNLGRKFELMLRSKSSFRNFDFNLFNAFGDRLSLSFLDGLLILDRSQFGQQYAKEFGQKRFYRPKNQLTSLRFFVDQSSIEIFVNEGETVFSMRYFTKDADLKCNFGDKESGFTLDLWEI